MTATLLAIGTNWADLNTAAHSYLIYQPNPPHLTPGRLFQWFKRTSVVFTHIDTKIANGCAAINLTPYPYASLANLAQFVNRREGIRKNRTSLTIGAASESHELKRC